MQPSERILQLVFLTTLLGAGVLGVVVWNRGRDRSLLDRTVPALIPVALVAALWSILTRTADGAFWDWNAARLAVSIALARGYDIYYPANQGPVLNHIYGPVSALAYLPAALWRSPTGAIAIGCLLSSLYYYVPALLVLTGPYDAARDRSPMVRWFGLAVFVLFVHFTFKSFALRYSASNIHADAPALGFALASCLFLIRMSAESPLRSYLAASVAAILAIGTKQTAAPLALALPLYVAMVYGLKAGRSFLTVFVAVGIIAASFAFTVIDFEALWFNAVLIPGGHSFHTTVAAGAIELFKLIAVPPDRILLLILVGGAFYLHREGDSPSRRSVSAWLLLFGLGVLMLPLSVMGFIKEGGDFNSFSMTLYFWTLGLLLMLRDLAISPHTLTNPLIPQATKAALAFMLLNQCQVWIPPAFQGLGPLSTLNDNPQQIAYEYARKNPGKIYFPWNPLSSLLAEGKLYHFDYGLYDRHAAGYTVTMDHFRHHVPNQARYVAFLHPPYDVLKMLPFEREYSMEYLEQYDREVQLTDLARWKVYAKREAPQE